MKNNKNFNNIKKILAVLVVVITVFCCFSVMSHAGDYGSWDSDYGDFSSDWDSGSDWGSSDSDWGSSDSDWDDSDFSIFDGGGIRIGGFGGCCTAVIIVIVVIIVIIIIKRNGGGKGGSGGSGGNGGSGGGTPLIRMGDSSSVDETSLNELRTKDPEFSEAAVLSWAENLFTSMQLAWSDLDYEPVRPFLGNALFEEHSKQLKAKAERDEKNCRSEIAVLQKKLERYRDDGHNEYLDVWMRIKMVDKLVKKSDPQHVIHPAKTFYMDFRWQLVRTSGAKTDADADCVKTGNCPNCGAPINMNQSGKCEYCGSVISTAEHDWVLNKIDALQQRTV